MGYYTRYWLKWDKADDKLCAAIAAFSSEDALNADGSSNGSVKWYNHEADMKALSYKFPGVLFTLFGEGEESGDIWKKYFQDGKMQFCKAVIDFPKFDAKLLK